MFFKYILLPILLISLIFPNVTQVLANSETVFDNPTFSDISGTALQDGSVSDSYPIAGDSESANEYCQELGMYLAYYTVGEPSPFGTKTTYDLGGLIWESTSNTTKLASQIICSAFPIIGITNAGGSFVNNYWDTNFPGTGSGQISDIVINAKVIPTLNMTISGSGIDLGDLSAGTQATGSLFLEIGTNAISGVSITARSQSGGLTHSDDSTIQINDLLSDGVAENYSWRSIPATTDDSNSTTFNAIGLNALEINNTAEHTVYLTNKPEASNLINDVEFIVSATSSDETPAGEYEDLINFTVIGNF